MYTKRIFVQTACLMLFMMSLIKPAVSSHRGVRLSRFSLRARRRLMEERVGCSCDRLRMQRSELPLLSIAAVLEGLQFSSPPFILLHLKNEKLPRSSLIRPKIKK